MAPRAIGVLSEDELTSSVKKITWKLPNFSSILRNRTHFYKSSCFNFANTPLHLQLYSATNLNGYLSVSLHNDSSHPCRISILFSTEDINGAFNDVTFVKDILVDNEGKEAVSKKFFKLSSLKIPGHKQLLTPSNTLKITCFLKLSNLGVISGFIGQLYQLGGMNAKQFEWHISHFPSLARIEARCCPFFYSPSFSAVNTTCCLQVYPGTILNGFLSLFLCNESRQPQRMIVSFSIRDVNGTLIESKTSRSIILKDCWGYQDFISLDFLNQSPNHFVLPDTLAIVCKVMSDYDAKSVITPENAREDLKDGPLEEIMFTETETLSKNLKNLFDSQNGWDTILNVQKKEFKVHRAILMAGSSVFTAMFQHDTKEKQTSIITIPDCDPDAIKKFLEFLYCGKLADISFDNAFNLYIISDKYNVGQVKRFCFNHLRQNLSVENFCDVATLANRYEDTRLLTAAQRFFNKNVAEILVIEDWKTLL